MMVADEKDHRLAVDDKCTEEFNGEPALLPLRLFRHCDLFAAIRNAPAITQRNLINTLHHIHFTNGSVLVHVTDPKYAEDYLNRCRLQSCTATELRCLWPEGAAAPSHPDQIAHLIVEDGLSLIVFPVTLACLDDQGFSFTFPEKGHLLGKRHIRRHLCSDVVVDLMQHGFVARGTLIDFTPSAFRIDVVPMPHGSFIWLNLDEPFTVCMRKDQRILFSGSCRCLRHTGDAKQQSFILAPLGHEIRRFRKKKSRTPRLSISPPPLAYFSHPFFGSKICRDIGNLSFAGFVVEENQDESVLLPGMIIHNLEIHYAGTLKMTCDTQVIYRRETKKGRLRCGIAILDMDFRAYRLLSHIMVHAGDPQARFSAELETDALWEFLFDTGFIYSQKYHLLQASRHDFKDTYRKLCNNEQDIEAHFTYQKNGKVYGYVSIVRAYQRAWMVHHLAARPFNGKRTGLPVLRNILRFFDGLYRFPSVKMDYMLFYFRPENHFPNLFFGGFARHLGNQQACSLDLFSYSKFPSRSKQDAFPEGWHLEAFDSSHLPILERFYRHASGGLLLDVLFRDRKDDGNGSLEAVYQRSGFRRQWRMYSLLHRGILQAVFIVNHSSPGLNLSELLNSITILMIEPDLTSRDVLTIFISHLARQFEIEQVPILIYPSNYAPEQGIQTDKQYLLWILDTQHGREYLDYLEGKTKMTLPVLVRHLLRKWIKK